ncbi:RhoGEF-domain-containing protein, partial [Hanseniaspora valbyensis NRRL Y-1626]
EVNGVCVLLSKCYSPTCTKDKPCYSLSCPRRRTLKKQTSMKTLNKNKSIGNIIIQNINQNYLNSASNDEKTLWSSSVPMEILEKLSSKEIKKQEAIYEVYVTEKNFVKSLETVRDSIIKTLAETNIIPHDIRKNFIKHVFAHVNDIYSVNKRFLDSLNDRMHPQNYIISGIGDIILKWIPFFEPFVFYIASRPYAKYLMETQRQVNPYFSRFDEDLMNSKLRHGIDSFLSQGVSRPGRYVLLVREILKSTDQKKQPKEFDCLTKSLELLNALMKRIDKASGAAQDRHDVILLKQKILFKNEFVNLGLNDEKRRIRHEGTLFRKEINTISNTGQLSNQMSSSNLSGLNSNSVNVAQNFNMNNVGDIQFYLLDNVLLFLKSKAVNKWNQHKVFQRPIPLPLLFVIPGEEMSVSLRKYIASSSLTSLSQSSKKLSLINSSVNSNAITFLYYGAKQRYQITLYGAQIAAITTLLDKIKQEQNRLIQNYNIFTLYKLSDKVFDYNNRILSLEPFDYGKKNLVLTNQGL